MAAQLIGERSDGALTEVLKGRIPAVAASDIVANTMVTQVAGTDRGVVMVTGVNQEPLGIARNDTAYSVASQTPGTMPVTVYDKTTEKLVVAGASVLANQNVGFAGAASEIHPISGAIVSYPTYGPVTGTSSSAIYRLGIARSGAVPGAQFVVRIDPKQLSGLS